jgi:hypothetical protein
MLQDLWDWEWIDRSTRSVVIEMTVLNTNTNVILNTRIIFELGATGAVRPGIRMSAFRVMFTTWAFNEGAEMSVFITQLIVFFMFVAQMVYQGWLIKRVGMKFFPIRLEHPRRGEHRALDHLHAAADPGDPGHRGGA